MNGTAFCDSRPLALECLDARSAIRGNVMSGIFMSYRRTDTLPWAGHLFGELRNAFGALQIFMDINGGIPRGADFEEALKAALERCDVLLALIGPQWATCTRSDGMRRLHVPADWVRNEIATALRRKIPIAPVLFGGAKLPSDTELPEDLRGLRKYQVAEITDTRWDFDVGELIKDLRRLPLLQQLHDVASTNFGFARLKDLIASVPAVSDTVSRSKEVIETTYREVGRLELFKTVHDALHKIEERCLLPLQAGGLASGLPQRYQRQFDRQARRIEEAMDGRELDANLRNDITDELEAVALAFQAAPTSPGEVAYSNVVNSLVALMSLIPAKLDVGISEAAAGLNLDRLAELMRQVRAMLPATIEKPDAELEPLIKGIEGLEGLREGLKTRVHEHGLLQRLDSKLRPVCVGETAPANLASEWARIKQKRARLAPPYSPELSQAIEDLTATEGDIETELAQKDEEAAFKSLHAYFATLSHAFQDVDASLKEFCLRLSAVSQPLKTVLQML